MKKTFSHLHLADCSKFEQDGLAVKNQLFWERDKIIPFNEMILSWDAVRPKRGKFVFYIQIKTNRWSPWICYASWGQGVQKTFSFLCPATKVKSFQDVIEILDGEMAQGFRVKVIGSEGADVKVFSYLYASTSDLGAFIPSKPSKLEGVCIENVIGKSQMTLKHHRKHHLCSPTSTSTVVNYLLNKQMIDPLHFASNVKDQTFDVYGNWVLNMAEANTLLGREFSGYVTRLANFDALHTFLKNQTPVVVSVSGMLKGAIKTYDEGHLMVVIGYDNIEKKVLCVDSAFTSDRDTFIKYDLEDFLHAWGSKKNLAYIFNPSCIKNPLP